MQFIFVVTQPKNIVTYCRARCNIIVQKRFLLTIMAHVKSLLSQIIDSRTARANNTYSFPVFIILLNSCHLFDDVLINLISISLSQSWDFATHCEYNCEYCCRLTVINSRSSTESKESLRLRFYFIMK